MSPETQMDHQETAKGPKMMPEATSIGGSLGLIVAALGVLLAALGPLLGRSWVLLGCSWCLLGHSWVALGRSGGARGRSWVLLVALGLLGRSWRLLEQSSPLLGRSWRLFAVPWAILEALGRSVGSFLHLKRLRYPSWGFLGTQQHKTNNRLSASDALWICGRP